MSADLKDWRGKITILSWCYIEAEHRASKQAQSEIVRAILHAWAEQKHHAAIEAQKLMAAEGMLGNVREPQGTPPRGGSEAKQ